MPTTYHKPKQMPSTFELMEAYRSWWRASYPTNPNAQAIVLAAAWAEHVLATYQAGVDQPTAGPINWQAECRWLLDTSDSDSKWTDVDQARWEMLDQACLPTAEPVE